MRLITCSTCGEPQPPNNFHRDAGRPNGRASVCKECRADMAAASREEPIYAMTQAEVAEALGMSRSGAAKAEREALKKMRAIFARLGWAADKDLRA